VDGGRERGPALEIERLIPSVDGAGDALVEERDRAPNRRDVDRQEGPVEDEDLGVQYGRLSEGSLPA
jgi:hypothetical protein